MITEFDKWDWIKFCEKCDDDIYKGLNCNDCESLRRQGWFEALKWAKNKLKNNTNGFFEIIKELENV